MSTLFSLKTTKINRISPLEHKFTEVLDAIALKPKMLYLYGELPQNMSKTVAIVGSRHNTRYGEETAYNLAYKLAKHGTVIISGLAYGIDSIGHRGCLDAGGTTIAVLGTPIDQIYPKNHLSLAEGIITEGGAIISEYAPARDLQSPLAPAEAGWDGDRWISYEAENDGSSLPHCPFIRRHVDLKRSFLYRNRLISGLSDAIVVVEAATKSGSLNTATHALAQGKTVFAVPGNINNPYSQGCNKLIQQGAIPLTSPDDVLEHICPAEYLQKQQKIHQEHLCGDTDVETLVLQALAEGARSGEDIMKYTFLPPEVFSETITLLEIKSRVYSLGLNHWGLR